MKPICVDCGLFYRPAKNGTAFIEGMPVGDDWKPYKLWMGDLWQCQQCGHKLIVGVGAQPIAEHYQPDFAKISDSYNPLLQVDDC